MKILRLLFLTSVMLVATFAFVPLMVSTSFAEGRMPASVAMFSQTYSSAAILASYLMLAVAICIVALAIMAVRDPDRVDWRDLRTSWKSRRRPDQLIAGRMRSG